MAEKFKEQAIVISQEQMAPEIYSLWIKTDKIAQYAKAGQFISIYCDDGSRLLPRPISICEIDKEDSALHLVYRIAGKGTAVDYKECNSLAEISTAGFASTTEVYKTAELLFMQDDAPKTVAVCSTTDNVKTWLSDPDNVAKGWRQLIVTSLGTEGESTIAEIISTVETLDGKMFFASLDVDDTTTE